VIAGFTGDETASDRERTMGLAYKALLADRGLMLSLMHAFAAGHDRVIGPVARDGFLRVYRIVRDEAGFEPVAAAAFMARGMLVDTLLALRITDMDDFDAMELSSCGFGVDHAHLVELRGLVGAASDFAVKR
jgi:hypothetical protein